MPKKNTSQTGKVNTGNPVFAEQQRLKEAENELLRKQRELEQLLKEAPAKIQKQRRRTRDFVRINVAAPTSTAIRPGGLRDRLDDDQGNVTRRRKPRRSEQMIAKVQFLVLCLILLTIGFLLWRSI